MTTEIDETLNIASYIAKAVERLDDRNIRGVEDYLPTGIGDLDVMIGGLHRKSVTLLGGCTGSGKTAMVIRILANISRETIKKYRVGYLSNAFSLDLFAEHLIIHCAQVESVKIRDGEMNDADWCRIWEIADKLCHAGIFPSVIDGLDFDQVCDRVIAMVEDNGLDLVIVDGYDHLPSEAVRKLKLLAEKFNVAILVTCSISEKPNLENRFPILSDFDENKGLIRTADVVTMLYRANYYFDNIKPDATVTQLLVAKNYFGRTGIVNFRFDWQRYDFLDMK